MKTLALQNEEPWKQLGTALRPYVEGPAVTLAVLLAVALTLTVVVAIETVVFAAILFVAALALAAIFFFVVGFGFLIVHPAGDLLLLLYLVWLLCAPRAGSFQQPVPELS